MAISDRIEEGLRLLSQKDYENAAIQLSIAVDGTAKLRYGKKLGNGERFRRFIQEFREFIYYIGLGGGPRFVFKNEADISFGSKGDLPNVFYKYVRNALLHEGDLTDHVVFRDGAIVGLDGDKFIATPNMLTGIALAVVGAHENRSQRFKGEWTISMAGADLQVGRLWGHYEEICKSVGFRL